MWADLNSRNWDQILREVQNIENMKESFTKVLIDTAKKNWTEKEELCTIMTS